MSHMKKFIVKTGLLAVMAWGGYSWVQHNPTQAEGIAVKAQSIAQTTESHWEVIADKTSVRMDESRAAAANIGDRLSWGDKAKALQDDMRPFRLEMLRAARPVTAPIVKSATQLDQKVSLLGIIFMLVTGGMVAVMGASMFDAKDGT